jgi:hypothetical protein
MRFSDRDGRMPLASILDTGVQEALGQVYWDAESFARRSGIYNWGKEENAAGCGGSDESKLQL